MKASPAARAIHLLQPAPLPLRPAALPPSRAWKCPAPVSATQTAAAPAQSRSRLREAPNQRAAPRPGRARARWIPVAGACALGTLVLDSWRRRRRRRRRSWRRRPRRPGASRGAGVWPDVRVGWAWAVPGLGLLQEGGKSWEKARSGDHEKRGRLEAWDPEGRAENRLGGWGMEAPLKRRGLGARSWFGERPGQALALSKQVCCSRRRRQLFGLPCVVVSSPFLAWNVDGHRGVYKGGARGEGDLVACGSPSITWSLSGPEYFHAAHRKGKVRGNHPSVSLPGLSHDRC